jgi:hypothetical protein
LPQIIRGAKEIYYDKFILNSKSKMETMWKITKTETGKTSQIGSAVTES